MAFTLPVEYQHRTRKFRHPDGYEIDSAEHATKILHLLNEASNMLLDLQVAAKGYASFLEQSKDFADAYRLIGDAYSSIYALDEEFGYNRNSCGKVWKYPEFNIVFERKAAE
jgi:hypothetical protein